MIRILKNNMKEIKCDVVNVIYIYFMWKSYVGEMKNIILKWKNKKNKYIIFSLFENAAYWTTFFIRIYIYEVGIELTPNNI